MSHCYDSHHCHRCRRFRLFKLYRFHRFSGTLKWRNSPFPFLHTSFVTHNIYASSAECLHRFQLRCNLKNHVEPSFPTIPNSDIATRPVLLNVPENIVMHVNGSTRPLSLLITLAPRGIRRSIQFRFLTSWCQMFGRTWILFHSAMTTHRASSSVIC